MVITNEAFITQMKLRELREQRNRLLRTYDELHQKLALEPTETGRLRVLYAGLRQITFAAHPLHPTVANLEPLLGYAEGEPVSSETVAFWRARLEKELASGQLRSEIVYLFGAILEEWAARRPGTPEVLAQREQTRIELTERLFQPVPTGNYPALLDRLFAAFALSDQDERAKQFQKAVEQHVPLRIDPAELAGVLEQLSRSPHHTALLRTQAQRFLADPIMQKELADALTIQLEHREEWQRDAEGVLPCELWTLTKWRLCFDEDLPLTCFLEILGQRWQAIFEQFFTAEYAVRLKHVRRKAPQSAAAFQDTGTRHHGLRASTLGEVDIWEPVPSPTPDSPSLRQGEHGSLRDQRRRLQDDLRDLSSLSSYDALHAISGMEKALLLIHAEIQLAQATPTPIPLHVLKLDCKDFYPGLSHQVLLDILQRYGATPAQRAFFSTFLQVPLRHQGEIHDSQRGVPHYHALSDLLGELVLGLCEQHVQSEAQVQIVRLVDDICLLATSPTEMNKAWQAVQTFCEAFGLILNEEKCGSVCIGGEPLASLPQAQPSWLLLTLDAQGEWHVNWPAFTAYLQGARQQVAQATSLIAQIETYNVHLEYLVKALALRADLGQTHRQESTLAMERFARTFFEDGQGADQRVIDMLRATIRARFLGEHATIHLPEAWLCWPLTAGGCGLIQATILSASYQATYAQRAHVAPPEERGPDWQNRRNAWASFYRSLTTEIQAGSPAANNVMETLVTDFIHRGSEMTNRHQAGLSPYWRWILSIYGPQMLDLLGTFRFLITELVPLQLIIQKYRQGAVGEESDV